MKAPAETPSHQWLIAIIYGLILIALMVGLWFSPWRSWLTSADELRQVIRGWGWLAPLVSIGLHIGQVVLAPLPGQAIDVANGYVFGWWGVPVSLAGIGLGSFLAMALARRYGRLLVAKLITPAGLVSVSKYLGRAGQMIFLLLFLLPGTPDDFICFAIGLTTIPLRRSILIAVVGRAPGVTAAVAIGAFGQALSPLAVTIISVLVAVVFAVIFRRWSRRLV